MELVPINQQSFAQYIEEEEEENNNNNNPIRR
jgi:hypothetical protein